VAELFYLRPADVAYVGAIKFRGNSMLTGSLLARGQFVTRIVIVYIIGGRQADAVLPARAILAFSGGFFTFFLLTFAFLELPFTVLTGRSFSCHFNSVV